MSTVKTTPSNLDRFKEDLDTLIPQGEQLQNAIQAETLPHEFEKAFKKQVGDTAEDIGKFLAALPSFSADYQPWYFEAKASLDSSCRTGLQTFVRHYEKPKPRKKISVENYRIEDCLQGCW